MAADVLQRPVLVYKLVRLLFNNLGVCTHPHAWCCTREARGCVCGAHVWAVQSWLGSRQGLEGN